MLSMGLLWFEPSRGIPLEERVDAAAERYVERFGEAPNLVLVPKEDDTALDRIAVRPDSRIKHGYLLIGKDDECGKLKPWKPLRRSSDDAEVVVFAPDGSVLHSLRPTPKRRIGGKQKRAAGGR